MHLVLALAAAGAYLAGVYRGRRGDGAAWTAAALLLHASALVHEIVNRGSLTIGVTEAISVFAWQAALLLWLFCFLQPLQALGLALYPLAAIAAVAAALWPSAVTAIPLQEWRLQLHVLLSLFSAGFLTVAAVQALTLAIQDRVLHRHAAGGGVASRLPPLETMERVLFQLITIGFFMLSLALVTGVLFVEDLLAQHLAHKTVLTASAWLIFGTLLWGRWRWGWRGRTAIRWTLCGYLLLVLGYLGSKLILEQILHKSWS